MTDTTGYGETPVDPMQPAAPVKSGVQRDEPQVEDGRRQLVAQFCKETVEAKKHFDKAFKRMRADQKFVRVQLLDQQEDDDRARVNVVQRHVSQRTASLYAKNPTFTADKKKRLEFAVWDGTRMMVDEAMQEIATLPPNFPPSPVTQALLVDLQQGIARKKMLDGVGRTLEIVMQYALDEQQPPFKGRAKKLVRRAITAGVSYVKLGYQRQLAARPGTEAKLADVTDRLAEIERLQADLQDNQAEAVSPEAAKLKLSLEQIQAEPDVVVREGLVFDFPASTRIIPDPCTQELVGWVGAGWVVEEFLLTPAQVQKVYGVALGSRGYTAYKLQNDGRTTALKGDGKEGLCCVWERYDRETGLVYVLCDGYPDFLGEPKPPPVQVEQFIPIYPLAFNDAENEDELFPPSDIEWLRPIQKEINRKREALRQHRIAARPRYVGQKGKFEDQELKDLASLNAHELLMVNALDAAEKLENIIQALPTKPIDPNLYETQSDIGDMQMVVGAQEANLGGTSSGASATETSIAESSRINSVSSNTDDLDDFLTLLARDAGQVLLREFSTETVTKIVGPGAVWPEFSRQELAEEVFLKIEAGSSGRPNKEQELANRERMMPFLLQMPGINPEWLARDTIKNLDSKIDLEEATASGLPSILTMNKAAQVSTGDPATDPNQQGGEGGDNADTGDGAPGGAQPAFPAGAPEQPNAGPV